MADWTGPRSEAWRVDVLDSNDVYRGPLDGVVTGGLDWNAFRQVIGGGSLTLVTAEPSVGLQQGDVDWLSDRLRVTYLMRPAGEVGGPIYELPFGIFLPSSYQTVQAADSSIKGTVTLLDKLTVLAEDNLAAPYGLAAGANIIEAVGDLIVSAGELSFSIQPSSATAGVASAWPAGTTKLTLINALLESAGYTALWADYQGVYRAEPYAPPAARAIMWEFSGGTEATVSPEFGTDLNANAVPNRVILVGQGTEEEEALIGIAENRDPESPYSYQSRGNRWITKVTEGVDAASQDIINQLAAKRLGESATPAIRMDLSHLVVGVQVGNKVQALQVNDAVINPDGLRSTIVEMGVTLAPGALAQTTLRRFEGGAW